MNDRSEHGSGLFAIDQPRSQRTMSLSLSFNFKLKLLHSNLTLLQVIISIALLFPQLCISLTDDTISATQYLTKNQTLVSSNRKYKLGFFKPNSFNKWYVGIWYCNIPVPDQVVVWVANRDDPVDDPNGVLQIVNSKIVIHNSSATGAGAGNNNLRIWWSSNNSETLVSPVLQLLDTGNLVLREVRDPNPDNYIWQSFDYPTDTWLPEMKLGWDAKTGLNRFLRSWKSPNDPSSGDYMFIRNRSGLPATSLWKKEVKVYRSWLFSSFGVFKVVTTPDEVYTKFVISNPKTLTRIVVSSTGRLQWFFYLQFWSLYWSAPQDQCDKFRECGTWGICNSGLSSICKCATGFKPKNQTGCVRKNKLECGSDTFWAIEKMKLPESSAALVFPDMDLGKCRDACRRNCSCNGYSNSTVTVTGKATGCVMWAGDLEDMRQYGAGEDYSGQTLYIKVSSSPHSELAVGAKVGNTNGNKIAKVVGHSLGAGMMLLVLVVCFVWKAKALMTRKQQGGLQDTSQNISGHSREGISTNNEYVDEDHDELELPLYDFSVIKLCTDGFSDANILGQGGFGCVYKGTLPDGQVVAVKRLSENSGQGMDEFNNEVRLIARLQHRNLVRLVGCCVEVNEKVLLYEYLPNRGLDSILFSKEKCSKLDWPKRFNIICGIARGLLYLHQDSRCRIIHRDLKASNILLDSDLNPRISDFGMARIFGRDQTEANTKRVVGTYGYMAPEYAMDGLFSERSDVFSFGVLVLEIVSGKRNRGFYYENQELNLLSQAWNLWRERKGMEIMDPLAGEKYSKSEVMRCIQVGLLCVQERAEGRPTMSSVVVMLSSGTAAALPHPKQPGFCFRRNQMESDSSSSKLDISCTENLMTVTMLDSR